MALVFRLMFLTPSGFSVERQTVQEAAGLVKHGIEGYMCAEGARISTDIQKPLFRFIPFFQ
jgi:hypothetical protein